MFNGIKIPESKTLGIIFLGIILYFGSVYLNIQKENSADVGIIISYILITYGVIAQIINWVIFWHKKMNEYP